MSGTNGAAGDSGRPTGAPGEAPAITDALRAHARQNPGKWTYVVDPALDDSGEVPTEGIVGAWKVDDNGEIDERFRPNEKYRPTPVARKWPEPTDMLDAVCQWAAAGWATPTQVATQMTESDLYAYAGAEDAFVMMLGPDGNGQVHLFSDVAHAPEGEDLRMTSIAEIVEFSEPTTVVIINSGSPGAYPLSADHLIDADPHGAPTSTPTADPASAPVAESQEETSVPAAEPGSGPASTSGAAQS